MQSLFYKVRIEKVYIKHLAHNMLSSIAGYCIPVALMGTQASQGRDVLKGVLKGVGRQRGWAGQVILELPGSVTGQAGPALSGLCGAAKLVFGVRASFPSRHTPLPGFCWKDTALGQGA